MALKAALVGCGRMGAHSSDRVKATFTPCWLPLSHAESMAEVDGIELGAVCDVVPEAAESTAAVYGVANSYTDYREMIRREKPDILAVATRTPQRVEIIKFAAANGVRGIHIEKPVAQTMAECLDAMEALDRHGVAVSYGVYRRYHPAYRAALEAVGNGTIGELCEMTVEFRRSLLLWFHPHSIDLMLMFAGGATPETVWADCSFDPANLHGNVLDEDPVVRHAYVRFDSGLTGTITQAGGMNLRLGGTGGLIDVLRNGDETVVGRPRDEEDRNFSARESVVTRCRMSATMGAFAELRDCLLTGTPSTVSTSDIAAGTRLLLSVAWSACNGGRPMDPADLGSEFRVTGRFKDRYA